MGIKFKQIDNLQSTFNALSGDLQNQTTANTDNISGVYNDNQILSGWKYFANNVDISGAQGLLVQNDNIYTPNNLIAGGVKIGFPIASPRNSTIDPLGALQVTGGQIYFENQLNIRNGAGIIVDNAVSGSYGIFTNELKISGQSVLTGIEDGGTGNFEKIAVNVDDPNESIEVSGNILLQNNDIIKWRDLDGIARNVLYVDSSDVLNVLNNTTGDGGKIVIRNKPGAGTSATFDSNGFLGIGVSNPQGILDISSTSSAPIMPRMTSAQMNAIISPVEGMLVYNTDSGKFAGYDSIGWNTVTTSAGITPAYGGAMTLGATPTWTGSSEITVSQSSAGNYTLNFSSAFASASSYHVIATLQEIRGNAGDAYIDDIDKSTSSVGIRVLRVSNGDPVDIGEIAFLIYQF